MDQRLQNIVTCLSLMLILFKVIEELQTAPANNEEKELLQLLSTPHLKVRT